MGLRRRLSKKWNETVNGVLSGPGVDVDSVNTENVDYTNLTPDYRLSNFSGTKDSTNQTTTSSSYATAADAVRGGVDLSDIPDGSKLYARFSAKIKTDTASETVTVAPDVFRLSDASTQIWESVEVTHTGDTNETFVDSGWQNITDNEGLATGYIVFNTVKMKITGGATGTFVADSNSLQLAGVIE